MFDGWMVLLVEDDVCNIFVLFSVFEFFGVMLEIVCNG